MLDEIVRECDIDEIYEALVKSSSKMGVKKDEPPF